MNRVAKTLTLAPSGHYDLIGLDLAGLDYHYACIYTVRGDQITIVETYPPICPTPGTYGWHFDGRALIFSATTQADWCGAGLRTASMTDQPWVEVREAPASP